MTTVTASPYTILDLLGYVKVGETKLFQVYFSSLFIFLHIRAVSAPRARHLLLSHIPLVTETSRFPSVNSLLVAPQ